MSNRATTVVFEGIPTYPNVSRCWNIIDKYQINIFYTAPTAIRSLMQHDDSFVTRTSRQSLRILGTVGEPINPEAWRWYHTVVGKMNLFKKKIIESISLGDNRCPIVDTWWQVRFQFENELFLCQFFF